MENSVEIILTALGRIIFKKEREFDSRCDFSTTTPRNTAILGHSDGNVALNENLKNESTTSKNVGDMVTPVQYLGHFRKFQVSTKPHLHFTVDEWKCQVTLGGETDTDTFNFTNPLSIVENDFSKTSIYPDQFNVIVILNSKSKIKKPIL